MTIFFGLAGGLAIFLYGMQLCSDGLQRAAAGSLKQVLHRLTSNRVMGVLVGTVVTVLLQSSSATTVMLVGLTSASMMQLKQTLGVILGADIGTTITVQLIAFNVYDYALLAVAVGFLRLFTAKRQKAKFIGQIILGFGLIFFGMKVMSDSVYPLRESEFFLDMIVQFATYPLLALLVSTLFTGIVQASAATVGLALSLSMQGLLPLSAAIPIILGANIGTCITAVLSSLGATKEAKRVALAHVLFKVLGVIVLFPFIEPFSRLVAGSAADVPRQIANAHTFFNIGITALFLPFTPWLARLCERLIPDRADEVALNRPKYLDKRALDSPAIAIELAHKEVLRVGELVGEMVSSIKDLIVRRNEALIASTLTKEEAVDDLYIEVSQYLSDISRNTMSDEESRHNIDLIHALNDLEHIGDCMVKICHQAQKKITGGLYFSEPGREELLDYFDRVMALYTKSMRALESGDKKLAEEVLNDEERVASEERELRESHIARLRAGLADSRNTSSIHLDLLNGLKRIADHSAGIAHTIYGGDLPSVDGYGRPVEVS